ncbi:MAG TPA: c-type cytochrome [Rhodospirillales bacterium]|jgi:cytochrome c oxidase cbb3-type subunit 3|nr:c-type cytochrome [Rhodospirillales bacterium]MDP7424116.1 c-type cytochrome [Rhodospirillales bacterium]MDP7623793.1 c-type cytochrome [Rhodospirillales bacterium]HJO85621.1 c-type cytochrome [Rhodospirillales bacterium]|tara:strand:- start:1776 stop:2153 length:378 start_codon:yes stop_codon:yes gene_type:complete
MKKLIKISLLAAVFGLAWLINGQTATAAGAEETFKFYCAQCHGLEGKGKGPNVTKDFPVTPRDFTNAKEMSKLSDNYIRGIIMDGGPSQSKSPLMPPWSKTILDVDVNGLIKHLRGLCKCKGKAG